MQVLEGGEDLDDVGQGLVDRQRVVASAPVSYTHLRAHETVLDLVCRLLLEKKKKTSMTDHTETNRMKID